MSRNLMDCNYPYGWPALENIPESIYNIKADEVEGGIWFTVYSIHEQTRVHTTRSVFMKLDKMAQMNAETIEEVEGHMRRKELVT